MSIKIWINCLVRFLLAKNEAVTVNVATIETQTTCLTILYFIVFVLCSR